MLLLKSTLLSQQSNRKANYPVSRITRSAKLQLQNLLLRAERAYCILIFRKLIKASVPAASPVWTFKLDTLDVKNTS